MNINDITAKIIDTAINIHRKLDPGLLESVYRKILAYELRRQGLLVEEEKPIPIIWDDITIDIGYRADLLVEDQVIVELKSLEELPRVHYKQILTHMKLADKRLGLLINFGEALLKDGIHRIVNQLEE